MATTRNVNVTLHPFRLFKQMACITGLIVIGAQVAWGLALLAGVLGCLLVIEVDLAPKKQSR
jgi:hypothetical protein